MEREGLGILLRFGASLAAGMMLALIIVMVIG